MNVWIDLQMAIQTQLYPSNAGPVFPLCGSQDLMIDNQSCFNFPHNQQQQLFSTLKHNQQVPVESERLQQLYNNKQRNQTMSLVDPTLFSNSNAFNINYPSTLNPQGLGDLMFPNQWDEVDQLIRLQVSFIFIYFIIFWETGYILLIYQISKFITRFYVESY